MSNFNVNISIEDVLNQKEQETVKFKPKAVFNEKNYLQARLANGEKAKDKRVGAIVLLTSEQIPKTPPKMAPALGPRRTAPIITGMCTVVALIIGS